MHEFTDWLRREDQGKEVSLMDVVSFIGRQPNLRPLGIMLRSMQEQSGFFPPAVEVGRPLGGPTVACACAIIAGKTVRECLQDGQIQAEAIITTAKRLKTDSVFSTFPDQTLLPEACGCELSMAENTVPLIRTRVVKTENDIAGLKIPNPKRDGRLPQFLKCAKLVSDYFTLPVGALVPGPFTFAAQLGGVELVARKAVADPRFMRKLMDFALETLVTYGHSLLEAGADMIVIIDPTASLLSARPYKEFAGPYTRQLLGRLGNVRSVLHICGRANHIIEPMCETGAAAISVDAPINLPSIVNRVPKEITIIGNLSTVGSLLNGTPEQVAEETTCLMDSMRGVPNFMVQTGCEVCLETPFENLLAMIEAVRSYR